MCARVGERASAGVCRALIVWFPRTVPHLVRHEVREEEEIGVRHLHQSFDERQRQHPRLGSVRVQLVQLQYRQVVLQVVCAVVHLRLQVGLQLPKAGDVMVRGVQEGHVGA